VMRPPPATALSDPKLHQQIQAAFSPAACHVLTSDGAGGGGGVGGGGGGGGKIKVKVTVTRPRDGDAAAR
jgi:hypothetical protein